MRILDRYILINFLVPFVYCVLGFIAIWLVFDLSDNGPDFIEGGVSFGKVLRFYLTQLPDIAVISLPAGVLLALLYSLSKMSRSNEIISMLTAGVSLWRMLLPLLAVGLLMSLLALSLNYSLAPHAQAIKEKQLAEFVSGEDESDQLHAHVFMNRKDNRLWYVEKLDLERNRASGTQIIQMDGDGNTLFKYYVRHAYYRPFEKAWHLDKGMIIKYDAEGNVTSSEYIRGDTMIHEWEETPWRLSSSTMDPEVMTVPQLQEYLRNNSDFPAVQLAPFQTHLWYRWSLPWLPLILAFIAAPLGIVFSRRGVLAGVASSIFIFLGMLFLRDLFLALGSGARIAPFWAAWTPNLIFLGIGVYLLWVRSGSRDLPKLIPSAFFRRSAARRA